MRHDFDVLGAFGARESVAWNVLRVRHMATRLSNSLAFRSGVLVLHMAVASFARAQSPTRALENQRVAKAQAAVARQNGWRGAAYQRLQARVEAALQAVEQDNASKLSRSIAFVNGKKLGPTLNGPADAPASDGSNPSGARKQRPSASEDGDESSPSGDGKSGMGSVLRRIDALDGADDAKAALHQVADTLEQLHQRKQRGVATVSPRFHMVFEGNRGSGKTKMAKQLALLLSEGGYTKSDAPTTVDLTELARDNTKAESQPDARKEFLDSLKGTVVIVDNFELLGGGGASQAAQAAKVWLADLAKRAETGAFTLVLTPTREEAAGVAKVRWVERLAPRQVKLPDMGDATLAKLLGKAMEKGGYSADEATVAHVARTIGQGRGAGFTNAVAVKVALRQAVMRHASSVSAGSGKKSSADHLELADFRDKAPDAKGPDSAFAKLDRMIGLGAIKQEFNALDQLMAMNDELSATGQALPKPSLNAVFVGNPGTGKTTVARLYGQFLLERGFLSSGEVVEVKAKDLIGKVVGETEKNVRDAFARAKGRVLFIDEAYAFYDA